MLSRISIQRCGPSPYDEAMRAIQKQKEQNMNVTTKNAVVGEEVKLTSKRYGDYESNPIWGGHYGEVKGKIKSVGGDWIYVSWSNGRDNEYLDGELEVIKAPATVPALNIVLDVKPKAVLLLSAVSMAVSAFALESKNFSAYDVTKAIRKQINDKVYSLVGVPFENINGVNTQRVEHNDVRPAVRSAVAGLLDYSRENTADGYILYKFVKQNDVKPAVVYTLTGVDTKSMATPATPADKQVAAPTSVSGASVVTKEKLRAYITLGGASLKQIQSRFKVRGGKQPTVREIAQIAKDSNLRLIEAYPFHASLVVL